ncbi:hypothetical protein EVAR_95967_1 [Eumeta japonica]|uniref:Uncharacterized protein n=1 Tax=Eumeta variegata TaxID=151549 RepID=A0A4C1V8Z9_EUMVA|nr:hypothetical protein EVAR_95967_1 [Eumeta japonica]
MTLRNGTAVSPRPVCRQHGRTNYLIGPTYHDYNKRYKISIRDRGKRRELKREHGSSTTFRRHRGESVNCVCDGSPKIFGSRVMQSCVAAVNSAGRGGGVGPLLRAPSVSHSGNRHGVRATRGEFGAIHLRALMDHDWMRSIYTYILSSCRLHNYCTGDESPITETGLARGYKALTVPTAKSCAHSSVMRISLQKRLPPQTGEFSLHSDYSKLPITEVGREVFTAGLFS